MDPILDGTDAEFLSTMNRRALRERIPVSGTLAITHRCNLRCVHCYVDGGDGCSSADGELTTDQWRKVIDEVVDAGCFQLVLTGGEPLLRRDFAEIYLHAKRRGCFVGIFSNGTLVTDELADLFAEWPPTVVEISLYGATAETYGRITGSTAAYARCIAGVERLLDRGVNVGLKSILMTLNRDEFEAIEAIAERYGVRFRMDASIFPRFNGDDAPLRLRVPPEEAVRYELRTERRREQWRRHYERVRKIEPTDRLYQCGAGRTNFHVDAEGHLQPCLMVTDVQYDLLQGSFADGWNGPVAAMLERRIPLEYECSRCEHRVLCGYCPPFARLENGDDSRPSEYLCRLGHCRFEEMMRDPTQVGSEMSRSVDAELTGKSTETTGPAMARSKINQVPEPQGGKP